MKTFKIILLFLVTAFLAFVAALLFFDGDIENCSDCSSFYDDKLSYCYASFEDPDLSFETVEDCHDFVSRNKKKVDATFYRKVEVYHDLVEIIQDPSIEYPGTDARGGTSIRTYIKKYASIGNDFDSSIIAPVHAKMMRRAYFYDEGSRNYQLRAEQYRQMHLGFNKFSDFEDIH